MKTKSWLVITLLTGSLLSLAFQFLLIIDRRLGVPLPYSVVTAFAVVMLMNTALLQLPRVLRMARTSRRKGTVLETPSTSALPLLVGRSNSGQRSRRPVPVRAVGMTMVQFHPVTVEANGQPTPRCGAW